MKYLIRHFYGKEPPIPEAIEDSPHNFSVEIDYLPAFAEEHGNIILSPPGQHPCLDEWFVWVTDASGKFKAK